MGISWEPDVSGGPFCWQFGGDCCQNCHLCRLNCFWKRSEMEWLDPKTCEAEWLFERSWESGPALSIGLMVFAWMEVVRSQEGKNDVMIFWGDTETPMTHKRKNKRQSFFSTYCKKVLIALRSILLLYYEGTICPPIFIEEYVNLVWKKKKQVSKNKGVKNSWKSSQPNHCWFGLIWKTNFAKSLNWKFAIAAVSPKLQICYLTND